MRKAAKKIKLNSKVKKKNLALLQMTILRNKNLLTLKKILKANRRIMKANRAKLL